MDQRWVSGMDGDSLRLVLKAIEQDRRVYVQSEIWLDILPVIDFSRLESLCLTCDHPVQTEQDVGQIYASRFEAKKTMRYPVSFLCRDCYEKHKEDILKPHNDFWKEATRARQEPDQRRFACVEAGDHREIVRYRLDAEHHPMLKARNVSEMYCAIYAPDSWKGVAPPIVHLDIPDHHATITYVMGAGEV